MICISERFVNISIALGSKMAPGCHVFKIARYGQAPCFLALFVQIV